ncbi:MAG: T9SS type A sorting domain-containing protein [Janthinobacterium lividum]
MHLLYSLTQARWPLAAALLGLLGPARSAQAQAYTSGSLYNTGSLYHGGDVTNAAAASSANAGPNALVYYAGTTFTNNGPYTATAGATDYFVGPANAAGTQTLAGTTAPSFYNLTLANGSGQVFAITTSAGVDISNTLTLSNGKTTTPTTPAAAIRLGSAAPAVAGTLGQAAGYVDGYLSKAGSSAFTFPLGATNTNSGTPAPNPAATSGTTIYAPVTLSSPNGMALRYEAAPPPSFTTFDQTQAANLRLATVSAKESYLLAPGPGATDITLPYDDFGPSGYADAPARLTIAGFDGTKWVNLSSSATNSTSTSNGRSFVRVAGATLTGFSRLALASTSDQTPLPVALVAFTATKEGQDGLLRWTTASERNSDYFELQASPDGTNWQVLATHPAAGTSPVAHDYRYLDQALARYGVPTRYYRLRQVDLDGTVVFSPVVALQLAAASAASALVLALWPNPVEAASQLRLSAPGPASVAITIYDEAGRLLYQQAVAPPATLPLPSTTWPSGSYVIRAQQGTQTVTQRLVRP